MDTPRQNVVLRPVGTNDLPRLEEVRQAAFAPVFASFRSILGEDIYNLAQAREDEAQGALLVSLLAPASRWEVYVADQDGVVVGFVSVQLNLDTQVGEIGLNAVHPAYAGKGIGTAMYDFAITRMRSENARCDCRHRRGRQPCASTSRLREGGLYGANPKCVAMPQALICCGAYGA